MPDPAAMTRFDIRPSGADFIVRIVTAWGETLDMVCTRDQLDVLADTLDDALLSEEADLDREA